MFGRRKHQKQEAPPSGAPGGVYDGLRHQILDLDPSTAGLAPTADHPIVWGALMEIGRPEVTATVVALADGTTSLYTSSGFGIIGGGAHARVVEATQQFLVAVENSLEDFLADQDSAVPDAGQVTLRALTFGGRRSAQAPQYDLGHGRHPLSGVFHAGQSVLTQLRLIDEEARSRNGES